MNQKNLIECVQCKDLQLNYQSKRKVLDAKFTLEKFSWDDQTLLKCDDYYLTYSIIKFHLDKHPQRKFWQNIIMKPCDPLFPDRIQLKVRGRRWGLFNLLFYPTASKKEKQIWESSKENYLQVSGYQNFSKNYQKKSGLYPSSDDHYQFFSYSSVFAMVSAIQSQSLSQTQAFSTKNLANYTFNELKKKHITIKNLRANEHLIIGYNHRNKTITPSEISLIYNQIKQETKKMTLENPAFFETTRFTNLLDQPKNLSKKTSFKRRKLLTSSSSYIKRRFFYLPKIQSMLSINEVFPTQFQKLISQTRYQDFVAYITRLEPWDEFSGLAASKNTPTYFNDYAGSNIHAIQSVGYENMMDTISKTWDLKGTKENIQKAQKILVNDLKIYPFLAFKTISAHRK